MSPVTKFSEFDFESIYPEPRPDRLAIAYFNRIYRKLHVENFSFLIAFYGLHRVGKSLSAVTFCYIIDPTFEKDLKKRVVYSSGELMSAFKTIRKKKIKGAGIIIDEAGTGDLSSQRWYEDMAKIVSANLQAVGYLNPFICFVTQNFSFINATARKLSNGVFAVSRHGKRYSEIKPYWLQNNPWSSGYYRKFPIFCEKRSGIPSNVYKINKIKIGLPPKHIRNLYEEHSQAYKDSFLESSQSDIDIMQKSRSQKNAMVTGIDMIAKEVQSEINSYRKIGRDEKPGIISEDIIRHRHALSQRDAKLVRMLVEQGMYNKKKKTT